MRPFARCLFTLLFLNSLYDFSLLCLVPFFFFWSRISSTCGLIAYPLFLNTADAIGCNQSRVEWLTTACVAQVVMKHNLSLSLYSIVNSVQARAGTMLGGKGRLSPLSVGRIDGPCSVCYNHSGTAESCGRQLIPIPLAEALLSLPFWRCTQQLSTTI